MTSAVVEAPVSPYSRENPPPPLVGRLSQHPLRGIRNLILLLIVGAVVTYLCVLIVAALYYDFFETIPAITTWWHAHVPDPNLRHAFRDVGEGLLGGLGGVFAVRNRYKVLKPVNALDRAEIALHIPNVKDNRRSSLWWLLGLIPLVFIYAQIGFWVAFGIVQGLQGAFHHLHLLTSPNLATHPTVAARLSTVVAEQWPNKLMGYAAAFAFGRRPAKAVFDDLQLWQCERRVLRGQTRPPWYYPPTWRATFHDVLGTGVSAAEQHGSTPSGVLRIAGLVAVALMAQGAFILFFVAHSS